MDQQQHYYFHSGDMNLRGTNIPQPSIHPIVTASGNHFILRTTGSRGGLRFPHPLLPAASHGVPTYPLHPATILIQNGFEVGSRHFGSTPSAFPPLYRHMLETTLRNQNHGLMGFIHVDDLALLVDHRSDMSNNIEDMSYEELLALGERIGNVTTGLSEEMIVSQMMTKAASVEQETESCVICQEEYKKGEKIGILQCKHEYHADCLRKWLLEKNVCPMCKSEALTLGEKSV